MVDRGVGGSVILKLDLAEGWRDVDWVVMIHDREHFRAPLYTVMNGCVFTKCEKFLD
jgi:hypothetical protein